MLPKDLVLVPLESVGAADSDHATADIVARTSRSAYRRTATQEPGAETGFASTAEATQRQVCRALQLLSLGSMRLVNERPT